MTFQPPPPPPGNPPPPPGGTPPPPPPGQWGPPPGGQPSRSGGFDPSTVNPLDWVLVGIGGLLLIFSFFSYYSIDIPGYSVAGQTYGGASESFSAWHTDYGTFVPWLAFFLGFLGAVVIALELFVPTVKLPLAARFGSIVLFAASVVFYLIGFATVDSALSASFSYYVSLILVIAGIVVGLMRAQQTNTALPGPLANLPKIGK